MGPPLAYLVISIVVAIVLSLARRQHHESRDGVEIFRYPSVLLKVIAFSTPVYGVGTAFIYSTFRQKPSGVGLLLFVLFFSSLILANSVIYLYLKAFSVEIAGDKFVIGGLRGMRSIPFQSVQEICVVRSFRGGAELILFDGNKKVLLKAGSTIADFDDLLWTIKDKTRNRGVVVRERDGSGKWSESIN